ncbi:hypothetical protein [Nocardia sp. NPDC057030]|uniref:hypothetical protein n=1 Tax=unclassified Nocardia TaxID=2637762 RepID=UPI00362812F4
MVGIESAAPQQDRAEVPAEVRAVPDSWRLIYFLIDGAPAVLRERSAQARDELRIPLSRQLGQWFPGKRSTPLNEMLLRIP